MTIVVEDGTGLSTAETYQTLDQFKAYWTARGITLADDYTDAQLETALRKGFQYINTIARYKAITLTLGQAGEFPRDGLTDWNGREIEGVPRQVKEAQNELSYKALTEELYTDLERGGRVAAESVGPISVSYFNDAPAGKTFRAAMMILKPFMRSVNDAFAPYIGGTAGQASTEDAPTELTPIFGIGMHTNSSD